jgi:hypothetical protein
VLPARFARLPGTVAIILGREPATLAWISAASAATTAAVAITVTVAVEPATASAATRPASTASTTGGFGSCFIHFQRSPTDFLAVQAGHGGRGFRIVGHFNECESAGAARFPVHGNVNSRDLSEGFKEGAELCFRRLETHIPDKNILHKFLSFQEWESAERAASVAGFRSLPGDSEHRMKSRGVNIPNAPGVKETPTPI